MATKRILSKATKITLNPWTDSTTPPSASTTALTLDAIVADSTTITQEDPTTETIECETSDAPIVEVITAGKYTLEMTSADISDDVLTKALGWTAAGTDGIAAPASYVDKFAVVEITFSGSKIVLPKVQLSSKLDASSLKSNVVKGTISGTALNATVKFGSTSSAASKETPCAIVSSSAVFGTGYSVSA